MTAAVTNLRQVLQKIVQKVENTEQDHSISTSGYDFILSEIKDIAEQALSGGSASSGSSADVEDSVDEPRAGTRWRHSNGSMCFVETVTHERTADLEKYLVTVIYRDENGKLGACPVNDWHTIFLPDPGLLEVSGWSGRIARVAQRRNRVSRELCAAVRAEFPEGTEVIANLGGRRIHLEVTSVGNWWWVAPGEIEGVNVFTGKKRRFSYKDVLLKVGEDRND